MTNTSSGNTNSIRYKIILLVLLIISFVNYSIGYDWGLTSVFQPDEAKLVEPLRQMVESKVFLHDTWKYPAAASSKLLAVILVFVRKFTDIEPIQYYFYNRLFCAFLGACAVYLTWMIVKRVRGEKFAIFVTGMMAIFPAWAQYSKEVSGDIPALFFSLLVLYMTQRYLDEYKRRYLILMGIFAAGAALEKWHGAWTCFYIAIILFMSHWRNILRFIQEGIIVLAAFLSGIVLMAPNILTDFGGLISGVGFVYVYDGTIENPLITAYPEYFFAHMGILSVIAVAVGVYSVFFKDSEGKDLRYYAMYIFSPACLVAFWVIMKRTTFDRWGCGVYWGMMVLMCEGLVFLFGFRTRSVRILGIVSLIAIIVCFVTECILVNVLATNTQKDGRLVGEQLVKELDVNDDNSISDYYTTLAPGGMRVAGDSLAIYFQDYGDFFAKEVDSKPYMTVPDIKYVVLGGYETTNKTEYGYYVVRKYGKPVGTIESQLETDVFWRQRASGKWCWFEGDTVRRNINEIKAVLNADVIGPSFTIYDVSGFGFLQ